MDRNIIDQMSEIARAMGDAGMAYISGGDVLAHLRRVRKALGKIEEYVLDQKNSARMAAGADTGCLPRRRDTPQGLNSLRQAPAGALNRNRYGA